MRNKTPRRYLLGNEEVVISEAVPAPRIATIRPSDRGESTNSTSAPDLDAEVLLTVQKVAQILNVPVSWVYEHVRRSAAHRLPHVRVGKYIRFEASAIRDWLEERQED